VLFFEVDLKGAINSSMDDAQVKTSINNKINESIPSTLADTVEVIVWDGPAGTTTKVLRFQSKNSTPTHKPYVKSIVIKPGSSNDLTGVLMLGTENGGIERTAPGFFRPAPNGIFFDLAHLNELAGKPQNDFNSISLGSENIDLHKIYKQVILQILGILAKRVLMV